MDLLHFIETQSSVKCSDNEYLSTLVRLSDAELATQEALRETQVSELARESESLAVSNLTSFVNAQATLLKTRDLCKELQSASSNAVELSLAVLRPPEHPYTLIRHLLETDALVYTHITQIEALLQLPEYVREVVSAGDFTRALDVAHTAQRLHTRFPHSQLINSVYEDVEKSMTGLKSTLLKSLQTTAKLPLLTKAVGHLKQLAPANLQQKFVDARWTYIQAQWDAISNETRKTQPLAYLKQVVEIHREQVFAVISAVNTVFAGDSATYSINQFVRASIEVLLQFLRTNSPRITDKTERSNLWLQLAFCSNSLGRVGADYWGLLDEDILSKEEWEEARKSQQEMALKARL